MKKILLVMVMLVLAVSMTFAYVADDINDIFTAPNMRARSDVLDVYFGTQNLKFAIGLSDPFLIYQNWDLKTNPDGGDLLGVSSFTLKPTIGVGYDFGVARVALAYDLGLAAIGASFGAMSHKPAIGLMFPKVLGGFNIRVSAAFGSLVAGKDLSPATSELISKYSAMSIHPYFELNTGFAPVNRIRLYLNYGTVSNKTVTATPAPATFGGELRVRTKITGVTAFALQPELRVTVKAAMNKETKSAEIKGAFDPASGNDSMSKAVTAAFANYSMDKPTLIGVTLPVFFNAENEYVSVELIPTLAFYTVNGENMSIKKVTNDKVWPNATTVYSRKGALTMFGYGMEMNIDFLINKNLLTRLNLGAAGATGVDNASGSKSGYAVSASCGLKWTF